jgi:uridine monophosphate synthetase
VRDPKDYGTGSTIEGGVEVGSKLLLVDDVITKGTSALEVLPRLQDYRVKEMLVLIDRESGGEKRLASHDIKLNSVLKMESLLWFWYTENLISQGDFHRSLEYAQRSQR